MKYELVLTGRFRKDLKLAIKRRYNMDLLDEVVSMLASGTPLPESYCDHDLKGDWRGFRECHITPDWLLIYKQHDDILVLTLSRTGSHSDLYR